MSSQFQGRLPRFDLIDDLIDSSASSYQRKLLSHRSYSNYSSLPAALNKNEQSSSGKLPDRLRLPFSRSDSSSIMSNNNERRKELDLLLKHLYDGKLISTINGDHHSESITTSTKQEKETSNNLEAFSLDGDTTSLQHELHEREFDIIHLRKEVQELQSQNNLLKTKVPPTIGHTSNNQEIEAIRHEKGILQHELRTCQELVAKLQHHDLVHNRSKQIDEAVLQQKEALEKKLKTFEKQIRILMHENEKFKRHSVQIGGFIEQLKGENDELQEKLNEEKKRNEDLFYQEFNALRNDLKNLKQRNNELFDENLRLQQRSKLDTKQRKNRSESPNNSEASDSTNYLTTINVDQYHHHRPPPTVHRSVTMNDSSPIRSIRHHSNMGHEESNRSKSLEQQQFTIRPSKSKRGVAWVDGSFPSVGDVLNDDDDDDDVDDSKPSFPQPNHSIYRSMPLSESPQQPRRPFNIDDRRQLQRNVETVSPRRPYAPQSVKDIHLNDTVKFSRPGGKISKGVVKYIGALPDKNDQYLGLELDDEESKHDGVYQDHRFFHCKPNKGVFVAFNKVIMAWSER